MEYIIEAFFYLLLPLPYLLFLIKNIPAIANLILISLGELLLIMTVILLADFWETPFIVGILFPFSIFVELLILGNILAILTIWVLKRLRGLFRKRI